MGTTLESPRRPFVRLHTRWLSYWPIDAGVSGLANTLEGLVRRTAPPLGVARPTEDEPGQAGRLALRLEGGALWARQDAGIPETLLYLTGGDTSVRGYGLRDIGIPQADGGVSPGRYLAVASVEWQRPIWRDGVRTPWESVVFVDAGAVADRPGDLRPPQWGVGAGVRYNSPVGPLQLDLGYGVKPKALRLHFNVGFTF
ncbi:outer membrane protein assembly complex, YaeT protein [compost metagenome]